MTHARQTSLEQSLARVQWTVVALVALVTVSAGGAVGAFLSIEQDDATSLALARTLVNELEEHVGDSPERLALVMQSELSEQVAFGRQVAIYSKDSRIGGTPVGYSLPRAEPPVGACRAAAVQGKRWRMCAARASTGALVLVAAPFDRLLGAVRILVLALVAAALGTSLLFGLLSRGIVRRALRPLEELGRGVSALEGAAASTLAFPARWSVVEVDGVAAAFDQLLARVRLAVERERRFVADASHELRTPLTRLQGQLELLASDPDAPDVTNRLRAAQRSCELLARTTESLLALARGEASLVEAVDLSEVAFEVIDAEQASRDPATAQRLIVDASPEALVRGDPQLLRLAVSNLVENALRYSDGLVRVGVVAPARVSSSERVQLVVEDEGPGLSDEDAIRLVRPFARGGSAQARGTGLGLALVDHVARVHGGALVLGRAAAGGLRATLSVPPWAPDAAPGHRNPQGA